MPPIEGGNILEFKKQYRTAVDTQFAPEITIKLGDQEIKYVTSSIPSRYGTNPNQKFRLYRPERSEEFVEVLKEGKGGFSLTNLQDASQAKNILKYFSDPACAMMKHLVPCGFQVSSSMDQTDIYKSARDCDDRSALGSVTAFNREVTAETAKEIMKLFTEVIVAPGYEQGAINVFNQKPGLRVVQYKNIDRLPKFAGDKIDGYINLKMLADGSLALETPYLTQLRSIDNLIIKPFIPGDKAKGEDDFVGQVVPTEQQLTDALTAWYLNINVRSNGVVLVKDGRAISVGTGQQERIGAVEQAVAKAIQKGHEESLKGSVLSSDAFFPNRDCIDHIAKYEVGAVIWPAGSKDDKNTIQAANEGNIALIVPESGERCFSHF